MNHATQEERVNVLVGLLPADYKKIAFDFVASADEAPNHEIRMEMLHRAMFYASMYQTETHKQLQLR